LLSKSVIQIRVILRRSFAGKPAVRLANTAGNFESPRLFLHKIPTG